MDCTVSHPSSRENFTQVTMGNVTVWFSYRTIIAVQVAGTPVVVRENRWGPTTGKHLNYIDGGGAEAKRLRRPSGDFESMLSALNVTVTAVADSAYAAVSFVHDSSLPLGGSFSPRAVASRANSFV